MYNVAAVVATTAQRIAPHGHLDERDSERPARSTARFSVLRTELGTITQICRLCCCGFCFFVVVVVVAAVVVAVAAAAAAAAVAGCGSGGGDGSGGGWWLHAESV